jgi:putative flippase GtrA
LEPNNSLPRQISRFSIAGFINTTIGYIVIFGGMAIGLSPYGSNFAGYTAGIFCSFFLSKKFVFPKQGKKKYLFWRYLAIFCISYAANLGVLHLCLQGNINSAISQIGAGIIYWLMMFTLSRLWVFK